MVILTREGERNEFRDDALVDRIETYGGGENEDRVAAFAALAGRARPPEQPGSGWKFPPTTCTPTTMCG